MRVDKPLVSVVVPIYNVEKYLVECFDSINNQTYKDIEIILINDGSTDSSGRIANDLMGNNKTTKVIHRNNGGLSDARNAGMKVAKGEFITFIDSDDTIDKDFVKNLVECALKNDADISQCDNSRKVEDLGAGLRTERVIDGSEAFFELMKFKTISPAAWGKLYRLSIFQDNNLEFPIGRIHEDTAVLYKLIYFAKKVVCLDQILYYYRINDNSIMTTKYTKKHYNSVLQYHVELDEFISVHGIIMNNSILNKHKAMRVISLLNKLAINGMHKEKIYSYLRVQYIKFSLNSKSTVCILGIVPAFSPKIFYFTNSYLPVIRRLLGKT